MEIKTIIYDLQDRPAGKSIKKLVEEFDWDVNSYLRIGWVLQDDISFTGRYLVAHMLNNRR